MHKHNVTGEKEGGYIMKDASEVMKRRNSIFKKELNIITISDENNSTIETKFD